MKSKKTAKLHDIIQENIMGFDSKYFGLAIIVILCILAGILNGVMTLLTSLH